MPASKEHVAQEKQAAGSAGAALVCDGARVGLGSGSTSACFIRALGGRIAREGLRVSGVPTSAACERLAREVGIPLIEPSRGLVLDVAIDGADEIGPGLALIKGGGGALLREKVVASMAREFIVIADSTKVVEKLGAFAVPVEVVPFAATVVMDRVAALGGSPARRADPGRTSAPWVTDQGNWLLDCDFGLIADPAGLARGLEQIPGVVGHGLFIGMARRALVAEDGRIREIRAASSGD